MGCGTDRVRPGRDRRVGGARRRGSGRGCGQADGDRPDHRQGGNRARVWRDTDLPVQAVRGDHRPAYHRTLRRLSDLRGQREACEGRLGCSPGRGELYRLVCAVLALQGPPGRELGAAGRPNADRRDQTGHPLARQAAGQRARAHRRRRRLYLPPHCRPARLRAQSRRRG